MTRNPSTASTHTRHTGAILIPGLHETPLLCGDAWALCLLNSPLLVIVSLFNTCTINLRVVDEAMLPTSHFVAKPESIHRQRLMAR